MTSAIDHTILSHGQVGEARLTGQDSMVLQNDGLLLSDSSGDQVRFTLRDDDSSEVLQESTVIVEGAVSHMNQRIVSFSAALSTDRTAKTGNSRTGDVPGILSSQFEFSTESTVGFTVSRVRVADGIDVRSSSVNGGVNLLRGHSGIEVGQTAPLNSVARKDRREQRTWNPAKLTTCRPGFPPPITFPCWLTRIRSEIVMTVFIINFQSIAVQ